MPSSLGECVGIGTMEPSVLKVSPFWSLLIVLVIFFFSSFFYGLLIFFLFFTDNPIPHVSSLGRPRLLLGTTPSPPVA